MNKNKNYFPKLSHCNAFQILCLKYRLNRLFNLLSDNTLKPSFQKLKKNGQKMKPVLPLKLTFVGRGGEQIKVIKRNVIRDQNTIAFSRRSYQILKDKPVHEFRSIGSFVEPIQRSIKLHKSFCLKCNLLIQEAKARYHVQPIINQQMNYQQMNSQNSTKMIKQQEEFDERWNKVFFNISLIIATIILIMSYLFFIL